MHYNFIIEHRSGTQIRHVDTLSRSNVILVLENNSFELNVASSQNKDPHIVAIRKNLESREDKYFEMRNGLVYRRRKQNLCFYVPRDMEH